MESLKGIKNIEEFIDILLAKLLEKYKDIDIVKKILEESDLDDYVVDLALNRLDEVYQETLEELGNVPN